MNTYDENQLERLVSSVRLSAKYQPISEEFTRFIGRQELERRKTLKEAIKGTKSRLHQVSGAYWERRLNYDVALKEFEEAQQADDGQRIRQLCCKYMSFHISTSERLGILEDIYGKIFAAIPTPNSVLDLACGLNPLSVPWMPLHKETVYYGCDLYGELMSFIGSFLSIIGVRGELKVCDLVASLPTFPVDLAMIMKTIPSLERIDGQIAPRLLDNINAKYLLITYPVHSLIGRNDKQMVQNYEARFWTLMEGRNWDVARFEYPSELVFLIDKTNSAKEVEMGDNENLIKKVGFVANQAIHES